eukprot:CAMPEP_0198311876 /NCGR_PEP_ID=MMETSP1450-20131203/3467_1 /TAXON_ID=753684 ORGANISM="Madagascaria erythrocladiodes, Strain CCMP3234" /NCGR_SAMPLE_ID=MMETSP1450 /ASSEMBLY_ACC=CAM_ASM_001115 /LENGTH=40 /DNA_ID= /DNA_START= /DNA_END= /DNA_ORIENTATION=
MDAYDTHKKLSHRVAFPFELRLPVRQNCKKTHDGGGGGGG